MMNAILKKRVPATRRNRNLGLSSLRWRDKGVQRATFGHSFLLLLGVVLSLTWFPNVQAATDCAAVTEIPQLECEALVALYNSTDGPNWKHSDNWNVTNTPCSWTDVTCVDGHVRTLWLSNNQLSGSIPSELGNLSQLTLLRLENNQLSGSIPSELENLRLTILYLYNNQLSGSIPSELGNLSQLRNLSFDGNQLSGSIPSELGNLSRLSTLYLNHNQLSGEIPSELGNLSQLYRLSLYSNQLSGSIPSELGNLTQLRYLYLSGNELSGEIPSWLGDLSQLTELRLNNNQLSGEIPSSLSNLSSLVKKSNTGYPYSDGLNLGYNHLTASDIGLLSFLDIKDPDWAETQTKLMLLTGCSDGGSISINPTTTDFGSEAVGDSLSLMINIRTQNCGDVQIETIEFTGSHASEFTYDDKECYQGEWQGETFSSCEFRIVFSPSSAGTKDASLNFTFNDTNVQQTSPIPLVAEAIDSALPNLTVDPSTHDFGTVTIGRGPFEAQTFTVENTGNVNLKFDTMALTGADASEFSFYGGCSSQTFLRPSEQCQFSAQLMPTSLGNKQANLNLDFGTVTKDITLTGTVTEPADCSEANITMVSVSEDSWDSPDTWNTGTIPTASDVVQIQHTITGIAFAQVKTLCIEEGGSLVSLDSTTLEIQATDYIQNKGSILGKDGTSETAPCSSKEEVGTESCAYQGASVILKVGTRFKKRDKLSDWWWYGSGGPILNTGTIKAGNGGDGSQYAAPGGNAIVLGRDTTNTGIIQAGNGGNLTGTSSGEAGKGGLTQIWGKLGGPGHLYNQYGAQALAGDGGNCNTTTQTGGRGGNLWLVSLPNVHLSGGQHKAGMGGTNCGTNGEDGWVRIEPSVIDLSGANTVVSGGNIAIYGGNDWTLDLSNLSGTVINATGDITLAVGEGGTINMKGSTGSILQAGGQVQIFADNLVLDENVALSDLVQASEIVVGPSKLLREVSLASPGKLSAEAEITLPVNLILSNNGPEADTYTLNVTDSAGWTLGQLPSTIEVKELDTVELVLNVTLPTTRGATDVITVTATSQADSEVKASTEVQVAVVRENIITPPTSPTSLTATAVSQSQIDLSWTDNSNDETGFEVERDGSLITTTAANATSYSDSGLSCGTTYSYSVKATNANGVSVAVTASVTTQACPPPSDSGTTTPASDSGTTTPPSDSGTTTPPPSDSGTTTPPPSDSGTTTPPSDSGTTTPPPSDSGTTTPPPSGSTSGIPTCPTTGVIKGMCSNRGQVLTDTTIGPKASIAGGELAGTINNQGRISQVTILSGAVISGGKFTGSIKNNGTLANIEFVGGSVTGGELFGNITNNSKVGGVFINVRLAANSSIDGGAVQGEIRGDPEGPALLKNLKVKKGSRLTNVIIGENVELGDDVELGEGVRFSDSEQIPNGELIGLLPTLLAGELHGIDYPIRADFSADILVPSEGILSAINALPDLKSNAWVIRQNAELSHFELTLDQIRFAVLPVSVKKATTTAGLEVQDAQTVRFITESGLEVLTHPALQKPNVLLSALSQFGLTEFTVQTNGNLHIYGTEGEWFSARPDWVSVELESEAEIGLRFGQSPLVSGQFLTDLVFSDEEGGLRQQIISPSVAQPDVLYSSAKAVRIESFGLINFKQNGKTYRGVVDYLVTQGETTAKALEVKSIPDANGDGIEEVMLVYPNGEQQRMFVIE